MPPDTTRTCPSLAPRSPRTSIRSLADSRRVMLPPALIKAPQAPFGSRAASQVPRRWLLPHIPWMPSRCQKSQSAIPIVLCTNIGIGLVARTPSGRSSSWVAPLTSRLLFTAWTCHANVSSVCIVTMMIRSGLYCHRSNESEARPGASITSSEAPRLIFLVWYRLSSADQVSERI